MEHVAVTSVKQGFEDKMYRVMKEEQVSKITEEKDEGVLLSIVHVVDVTVKILIYGFGAQNFLVTTTIKSIQQKQLQPVYSVLTSTSA